MLTLASSPVSPICFNAREKQIGETGDEAMLTLPPSLLYKARSLSSALTSSTAPSSGTHIYHAGDVDALEKVQRLALQVCLKNWSSDHNQLYMQSQIPALSDRRKQSRLSHLFKIVNDLTVFPEAPLQYRTITYNNRFSHALQLQNVAVHSSRTRSSPGPLYSGIPCPAALSLHHLFMLSNLAYNYQSF